MALGTFVAGRYSGTWNAVDVGITREGYELQLDAELEEIGETDAWGQSVIDGIFRGGNCHLQFVSTEYKAGSTGAFWPWGGGVLGQLAAAANPIGVLASAAAKAMVLTSTANTPAAAAPATLTGTLSLLARNFNGRLLFNSKLRDVPVRLRLYPNTNTGVTSFFVTT